VVVRHELSNDRMFLEGSGHRTTNFWILITQMPGFWWEPLAHLKVSGPLKTAMVCPMSMGLTRDVDPGPPQSTDFSEPQALWHITHIQLPVRSMYFQSCDSFGLSCSYGGVPPSISDGLGALSSIPGYSHPRHTKRLGRQKISFPHTRTSHHFCLTITGFPRFVWEGEQAVSQDTNKGFLRGELLKFLSPQA